MSESEPVISLLKRELEIRILASRSSMAYRRPSGLRSEFKGAATAPAFMIP